jgi:hypothetical protein
MVRRVKPVEPPAPEVKRKGTRRVGPDSPLPPSFADLEKEHRRVEEAERSGKRVREEKGPTVAGGTRAGRPRSGRSGSDSNASRRSRGH